MSSEKGFSPIFILLGVVLIVAIAGGAFYFGTKYSNPSVPLTDDLSKPLGSVSLSPTVSNELVSDWKTYSNSKFSISYPSDFYFKEFPEHLPVEDYAITSVPYDEVQPAVSFTPGNTIYISAMFINEIQTCSNNNEAQIKEYNTTSGYTVKDMGSDGVGSVRVFSSSGHCINITLDGYREGKFDDDIKLFAKVVDSVKFNN